MAILSSADNLEHTAMAHSARRRQGIETEGRIICIMKYGREYTVNDIVNKTGFTRSRVNHAIDRLMEKGEVIVKSNSHKKITLPPLKDVIDVEELEKAEKPYLKK